MKPSLIRKSIVSLAATVLGITLSLAAPYDNGQQVEAFTAKDQYEQAFTFKPAETRHLLVSHDMETGKQANAALTALGKVTVLNLSGGKVQSVAYWTPGAEGVETYLK